MSRRGGQDSRGTRTVAFGGPWFFQTQHLHIYTEVTLGSTLISQSLGFLVCKVSAIIQLCRFAVCCEIKEGDMCKGN